MPLAPLRRQYGLLPSWHAFRGAPCALGGALDPAAPFGIRLLLTAPLAARCDATQWASVIVHAAVASLQAHPSEADRVAPAVANALGQDRARIAALLASDERAVLGRAPAASGRGQGWGWTPGKAHPWAGEVLVRRAWVDGWSCSGTVFALERAT